MIRSRYHLIFNYYFIFTTTITGCYI